MDDSLGKYIRDTVVHHVVRELEYNKPKELEWHDCMDCGRSYVKVPHVCKSKDLGGPMFIQIDPTAKIEPPGSEKILKTLYAMARDRRLVEGPSGWFRLREEKSE